MMNVRRKIKQSELVAGVGVSISWEIGKPLKGGDSGVPSSSLAAGP